MEDTRADSRDLARSAVGIAIEAGHRIMDLYGTDHPVQLKNDSSPLTLADRESHEVIVEALRRLTPTIGIISEESTAPHDIGGSEGEFWLVDPLDGTREFIKRTGEFTVNIALVAEGAADLYPRFVPTESGALASGERAAVSTPGTALQSRLPPRPPSLPGRRVRFVKGCRPCAELPDTHSGQ